MIRFPSEGGNRRPFVQHDPRGRQIDATLVLLRVLSEHNWQRRSRPEKSAMATVSKEVALEKTTLDRLRRI